RVDARHGARARGRRASRTRAARVRPRVDLRTRTRTRGLVIDKKKLDACVHCGLCLTACPTYDVTGNELDSPRGRIAIVRGLAEGKIADVAVATEHLDLCLGCRACEPACPSGVRYGAILEEGCEELGKRVERPFGTRFANSLVLRHGLGTRFGTKTLMRLLW